MNRLIGMPRGGSVPYRFCDYDTILQRYAWSQKTAWQKQIEHQWEMIETYMLCNFYRKALRERNTNTRVLESLDTIEVTGPPPLSEDQIKSLPLAIKEMVGVVQCMICLENIKRRNSRQLPCRHVYHLTCIMPWLKRQATCPLCRQTVQLDMNIEKVKDDGIRLESAGTNRHSLNIITNFGLPETKKNISDHQSKLLRDEAVSKILDLQGPPMTFEIKFARADMVEYLCRQMQRRMTSETLDRQRDNRIIDYMDASTPTNSHPLSEHQIFICLQSLNRYNSIQYHVCPQRLYCTLFEKASQMYRLSTSSYIFPE